MPNFVVHVTDIDFDLETDDPWEETMDMDKDLYRAHLQDTYGNRNYTVTADDVEEAEERVMNEITDRCGWCINHMEVSIKKKRNK